jgi:O-antigen/teichoic acid export membrane protein
LALAGSLALGVLYYFLAPFVFAKYPSLLANHGLMTLWLVLVPVTLVMAESFRGLHDIRDSVLFGGAAFNIVYIAGAVIFAWLGGFGFTAMLVLAACAAAVNLALGLLLLRSSVAGLKSVPGDIVAGARSTDLGSGELLREALPLMLNLLFGLLIGTLDLWIVGLWFQRSDMANYALAARVVLVMVMPSQIVQGVIPPMISELHELGRRHELEQLLRGSATAAAIPSFLAMLVILVAGGWIVPILFTENFGPAAFTLNLLTFGQLISVMAGSPNFLLMMTGHQRPAAVCGVVALVLLAVLAAILGHYWGPNGVAVAAGISLSVYKISLALLGWRLLNVRCWVDPTLASVRHLIAQRRGAR